MTSTYQITCTIPTFYVVEVDAPEGLLPEQVKELLIDGELNIGDMDYSNNCWTSATCSRLMADVMTKGTYYDIEEVTD